MEINNLSPNSKVWIYQSDRKLTNQEVDEIKILSANFVAQWAAHGAKLNAKADVLYNYFIVLIVDENQAFASGCSIDSSVAFIKQIGTKFNIDFFNRLNLAFINENKEVEIVHISEIDQFIQSNKINPETTVFNNLVTNLDAFNSKWKISISNSWASKYLNKTTA
jgi:hypothetical protein